MRPAARLLAIFHVIRPIGDEGIIRKRYSWAFASCCAFGLLSGACTSNDCSDKNCDSASGADAALDSRGAGKPVSSTEPGGAGGSDATSTVADSAVTASEGDAASDVVASFPEAGVLEPRSVSGTVVDRFMMPLSGISIRIDSVVVQTDGLGQFTIPNVVAPYTLVASAPTETVVYESLTRSEPTIQMMSYGTAMRADLAGTLTGGAGFPDPPGHYHSYGYAGSYAWEARGAYYSDDTNQWDLHLTWTDRQRVGGTLMALQFAGTDYNAPTSFTGLARKQTSVTDGDNLTMETLNLDTSVTTEHISGSIQRPEGYPASDLVTFLIVDSETDMAVLFLQAIGDTFSVATPAAPGIAAGLVARANGPGVRGQTWAALTPLSPHESGVNLTLPRIAVPLSPLDGATALASDVTFSWAESDLALYRLKIAIGDHAYYVVTTAREANIASLVGADAEWPSNVAGYWEVLALSPFKSSDEAASAAGYYGDYQRMTASYSRAPSRSMSAALSQQTTFTSATSGAP